MAMVLARVVMGFTPQDLVQIEESFADGIVGMGGEVLGWWHSLEQQDRKKPEVQQVVKILGGGKEGDQGIIFFKFLETVRMLRVAKLLSAPANGIPFNFNDR